MVGMVLAMCAVVMFVLVVRVTGTLTRLVNTVQRMNLLMKAGVNVVIAGESGWVSVVGAGESGWVSVVGARENGWVSDVGA